MQDCSSTAEGTLILIGVIRAKVALPYRLFTVKDFETENSENANSSPRQYQKKQV
jgi:hypothetical protein